MTVQARMFLYVSLTLSANACASVTSQIQSEPAPVDDGLVYYMPKRPIQAKVTIDEQSNKIPSIETGTAYPDLGRQFVLKYRDNFMGKNHAKIEIKPSGLLQSLNSDVTSGVGDIARNIARAAGYATAIGAAAVSDTSENQTQDCHKQASYIALISPPQQGEKKYNLCGVDISVTLLDGEIDFPTPKNTGNAHGANRIGKFATGESYAGIFYKRDLPYLVHVKNGTKEDNYFIAFSPDWSDINFMPIDRTLFANNDSKMTLSEGVLTSFEQTVEGEVVAASAIPADIIAAYFGAIGELFGKIANDSEQEAKIIANDQALALARIKQQTCASTIAANPISGKTAEQAANALTVIKAACS